MATTELALNVGVVLAILTTGVALMLLLVSALSYARLRSRKFLLAGGAFLVLALQGALGIWRAVTLREADVVSLALDAAILAFLYASVAVR